MVGTLAVGAILALASRSAGDSRIIAFTVLFLALTFLAVAAFLAILLVSARQLMPDQLAGLAKRIIVLMVVMAAETGTLLCAFLARGEALAVHFEAFCFFAGATRFLLLYEGS